MPSDQESSPPTTLASASDDPEVLPEVKVEPAEVAADRSGSPEAGDGAGQSFAQMLTGTMAPPPAVLTLPVIALPCFLAPAGLIESPGFRGQFAMSHQAVLASVTAQAQMQMQIAYPPTSELMSSAFSQAVPSTPNPVPSQLASPAPEVKCIMPLQQRPSSVPEVKSHVPLQQRRSPVPEGSATDAYNWRKYGQKHVKVSDNSRSYYRCTDSNCSAKKKVERCPDGTIVEITYSGMHTHDPPKKYKYAQDKVHQTSGASGECGTFGHTDSVPKGTDFSACKDEKKACSETHEQQLAGTKNEVDASQEPDAKRRFSEIFSTPVQKTVREYIVQTEIDARHLSDGYRWRKYGQKMVKGNPNPRSYYRCTHEGCPVRKHVERASHDAKALLITYEGKHNHDQPASKYTSESAASSPKGATIAVTVEKSDTSAVACEKPDTSGSLLDKVVLEDSPVENFVKKEGSDEKPQDLQTSKAIESAQALLSIGWKSSSHEDSDRTNADDVKSPLFNESKTVVPVPNS